MGYVCYRSVMVMPPPRVALGTPGSEPGGHASFPTEADTGARNRTRDWRSVASRDLCFTTPAKMIPEGVAPPT